jgi:hypothetical protein
MVTKNDDLEYELLASPDTNNSGKTQWFFFSVSNTTNRMTVRFNILNFEKDDSLYNKRMRVLIFSVKEN